jgi:ParB family chromosome partitioning protein
MSPALRRVPLKYLLERLEQADAQEREPALNKAAALYAGTKFPPLVAAARRSDSEKEGDLSILAGRSWLLAAKQLLDDGADLDTLIGQHVTCSVVDLHSPAMAALRSGQPQKHVQEIGTLVQGMFDAGENATTVARQLGTNVAAVRRLAAVAKLSPRLLAEFAHGRLSYEQLVAFTLTEVHADQEALLAAGRTDPWQVRKWLHKAPGPALTDRRYLLVGEVAYLAAGGNLYFNKVEGKDELWVTDVGLLERLAVEKLSHLASTFSSQGWGWLEVHTAFSFDDRMRLKDAPKIRHEPHAGEALMLRTMRDELNVLNDEYERLGTDADQVDRGIAIERARASLENEIEAKEAAGLRVDPSVRQFAGIVITISKRGAIEVLEGLVRPEDEANMLAFLTPAPDVYADGPRLLAQLQRQQMLELQRSLGAKPDIAVRLLAHSLLSQLHYKNSGGSLLTVKAVPIESNASSALLKEAWREELPVNPAKLWEWLMARDEPNLISILGVCAALSLVSEPTGADSLAHVNAVCSAVGLNMAEHWAPSPEFLQSVSRMSLEAAVTEAVGKSVSESLAQVDDQTFRQKAGAILSQSRWVPPYFRRGNQVKARVRAA